MSFAVDFFSTLVSDSFETTFNGLMNCYHLLSEALRQLFQFQHDAAHHRFNSNLHSNSLSFWGFNRPNFLKFYVLIMCLLISAILRKDYCGGMMICVSLFKIR